MELDLMLLGTILQSMLDISDMEEFHRLAVELVNSEESMALIMRYTERAIENGSSFNSIVSSVGATFETAFLAGVQYGELKGKR